MKIITKDLQDIFEECSDEMQLKVNDMCIHPYKKFFLIEEEIAVNI